MSKITNDGLTRVRHRMLCSCTHMATVGVKGLLSFLSEAQMLADCDVKTLSFSLAHMDTAAAGRATNSLQTVSARIQVPMPPRTVVLVADVHAALDRHHSPPPTLRGSWRPPRFTDQDCSIWPTVIRSLWSKQLEQSTVVAEVDITYSFTVLPGT